MATSPPLPISKVVKEFPQLKTSDSRKIILPGILMSNK
jgi:hypothetical protein